MTIIVPSEVLQRANLSEVDFWQELALLFYQQKRLTLGQAANLTGLDLLSFQRLLGRRNICIHYDEEELAADLAAVEKMGLC